MASVAPLLTESKLSQTQVPNHILAHQTNEAKFCHNQTFYPCLRMTLALPSVHLGATTLLTA